MDDIGDMVDQLTSLLELVNTKPKFFEQYAKIIKNMHDALVKEGFTTEQALMVCQNFKVND